MNSDKKEIFDHYMDMAGFVTIDRDPGYATTKNGLFSTGFAICVYDHLGLIGDTDKEMFEDTVKSCQDEQTPGVYDRYPAVDGHPRVEDPNSRDDTAGVVAGSAILGLGFEKDVMEHFSWADNTDGAQSGLWALRLRFVFDVMWYFVVNKKFRVFTPLLMLYIYIRLLKQSVNYSVLLDFMLVHSLSKKSKLWARFKKLFMKKAKLAESTREYFKDFNGYIHPINNLVIKAVAQ